MTWSTWLLRQVSQFEPILIAPFAAAVGTFAYLLRARKDASLLNAVVQASLLFSAVLTVENMLSIAVLGRLDLPGPKGRLLMAAAAGLLLLVSMRVVLNGTALGRLLDPWVDRMLGRGIRIEPHPLEKALHAINDLRRKTHPDQTVTEGEAKALYARIRGLFMGLGNQGLWPEVSQKSVLQLFEACNVHIMGEQVDFANLDVALAQLQGFLESWTPHSV